MAQAAGYSFNSSTVSGSTVRDLAGYFLHGTITGSAAITTGKYGNGLNCTGGAMQVANINQFTYPVNTSGGLSIAAWVKLNTTTAAPRCISSAKSTGLDWALYASNASGNVEAVLKGVTYSTTTSIRDGAFHHVFLVVDHTSGTHTVKIYVDGVQVLSSTLTADVTYTAAVTTEVGRNVSTGLEALDGIVDDYRWWNDPVEAGYVSTVTAAEQVDFQVAIYGMDDDTSDDLSIYNRDLTVSGTASFGAGLYGRAISSSATEAAASGVVSFGDLDRLAITGWVRLDSAPVAPVPILAINSGSGASKLRVVVNVDRTITQTWATIYGSFSVTSPTALTVGQWSRFHFGMNPTYVNVRLDTNSQTTTLTGNGIPHLTPTVLDLNTLYIGGDQAAGGRVSFDYLNFTRNFIDAPASLYWIGPVSTQVSKPANIARGVYEFNENSGTTALDKSPYGNTLTLQTGAGWVTGVQGSALGEGTAAGPAALNNAVAWSATPQGWAYSAWVKCRTSSAGARFLVMRNGTSEVAHTGYLNNRLWVRLYGSGGGNTGIINPTTAPITAETWTHVAASCNGSTVQVFLNGQRVASADYTVGTLLVPTILRVGGDDSGEGVADVDSLTLFDTPLSDSSVAWLYQNPGMFAAGTPVENTRSTTWNTKAQVSNARVTTWDTRTVATATRSTTWNTFAALVPVSTSRSTTWNVASSKTPVAAARLTTWNLRQIVSALRATTWRVESDTSGSGFTVRFPTYRVPLGTKPPLDRQWMDMPKALVKYNGEWLEVAVPYNELLRNAEKFYLGGYHYELTSEEVADLPPQYVEEISA
jgi:hypothetical protein